MSDEHKVGEWAIKQINQLIHQEKDCIALEESSSNLESNIDPNGGGTFIQCCSSCTPTSSQPTNNCSGKCEGTHSRGDETKDSNEPPVIKRGDLILSCPALSLALDGIHRKQRCGYCTTKLKKDSSSSSCQSTPPPSFTCDTKKLLLFRCQHCHLISICEKCQQQNVHKWHIESGECRILCI